MLKNFTMWNEIEDLVLRHTIMLIYAQANYITKAAGELLYVGAQRLEFFKLLISY